MKNQTQKNMELELTKECMLLAKNKNLEKIMLKFFHITKMLECFMKK